MKRIKNVSFIALIVMTILSFSNLTRMKIAGASVIVGILFFFIIKAIEKQSFTDSGLEIKAVKANLKVRGIWIWIALPLVMDAICIAIAKLVLPEYLEHVLSRAGVLVSFDKALVMVFQLAVLALGEEIAWRAFFQKQLNNALPIMPALLITSVLFALGHVAEGKAVIVIYDTFFVFINSVLYGVIFYKTNNAWVSAISHFVANLFSVIILLLL